MNRLLYVLLLSALTITGFSMYKQNDIGFISISFANFSFETNFIVLGATALCALFIISVIAKLLQAINGLFIYIGSRRQNRLKEKSHLSLTKGLIEYAEGRFGQAEKILLQHVNYSDNKLLVYLSAARAAQQRGDHEQRDEYLRKAHKDSPDADIAIGLTKAELQLAHDQKEQALATLRQLHKSVSNHSYVLTLLANTYKQLQDWDNLSKILTPLKKYGKLSDENFLSFEVAVCNGQLTKIADNYSIDPSSNNKLLKNWKDASNHLKNLPEVVEHYAKQLIRVDAAGEAENTLRLYLNKNWQETSVILYSELDVVVDNKQLEMVENWLKDHQHNAHLLLSLGKMCISRSLWGKARNYLEASIAINPMPENYLKLARLLEEHMIEPEAAQEYYRQGLHLMAGNYSVDILNEKNYPQEALQLKIVKT